MSYTKKNICPSSSSGDASPTGRRWSSVSPRPCARRRVRADAAVFGYSERLLGRHERSGPWSPFPIFRSSAWSRHTWPSSPATSATSASPRNAREKVDGGLGRTGAALSPRWAWPFPSSSRSSSSPSTCSLPSACAKALSRFRLDAYRCFRKHRHRDLFL